MFAKYSVSHNLYKKASINFVLYIFSLSEKLPGCLLHIILWYVDKIISWIFDIPQEFLSDLHNCNVFNIF